MAAPQPEFVEVRCAGCGETLEVEPGLTEFACPDCGTQQALPPELMPPPPPRPRRALPIPGRGPPAAAAVPVHDPVRGPTRMPCGGCGAVLSVPAGLGRFACPLCCVELVVDGGRLRPYLASPAAATVSVVAPPPAGVTLTSPSPRQRPEAQVERHDRLIRSEQTPAQCAIRSVHREEAFSSYRTDSRAAIHGMLTRKEPVNPSVHREESHTESLNMTTAKSSSRKTGVRAGTESTVAGKVQQKTTIQGSSSPLAQARPASYVVRRDHAQGQHPIVEISGHGQQTNDVSSTMEKETLGPLNEAVPLKQLHSEYQSKTIGWNPKKKRSGKSSSGNKKRKNKDLTISPNEELHLRRSKRLTKEPEHPINDDPVQQPSASPNQYISVLPDIDRIIANLNPSPLRQRQLPESCSSQSGHIDETTLPTSSNHGIPRAEQFPHCYSQLYPPEVRDTRQLDKNGEQVQPASAELHMQQEDEHGNHLLLGSDGRSSDKRRGRRPTRLTEPRREVDRPVLTPNNIDSWDVNPPCPKVASTITVLMKQKYPGSTYLPAGQHADVPPNEEVVHHWYQYPAETRDAILNEFLQRYKWAPGKEAECLKIFNRRGVRQFAGLLCEEKRRVRAVVATLHKAKQASGEHKSNTHEESEDEDAREEPADQDEDPLKWKPFHPAWMYPNWWHRLCEHWAKEEVLNMSLQNRKNRYTGGHAHHTTGSRSFAMHRQLMVLENGGRPVSELEVFNKTHKLNGGTGEYVSEKAKRTVEGFKKRMEEVGGDKQIDPHLAWAQEVGGRNRGRFYGLTGVIDKAKIDELVKANPGCFGNQHQKFSQDQVQQMINQALQGLNETWEKKFTSLEKSVRGVPLLGVDPEHGPLSSAIGGGIQKDRSRHQDGSDSQHRERRQSGRYEDEDDGDCEEVVSTSV